MGAIKGRNTQRDSHLMLKLETLKHEALRMQQQQQQQQQEQGSSSSSIEGRKSLKSSCSKSCPSGDSSSSNRSKGSSSSNNHTGSTSNTSTDTLDRSNSSNSSSSSCCSSRQQQQQQQQHAKRMGVIDKVFSDTAVNLQARTEALTGVSLPFLLCLLLVCAAYATLAAAALRVCWRVLGGAPLGGPLRRQQQQVVLLGPSASGKTCCLLALRNGRGTPTVSSLEANRCSISLSHLAQNAAAAAARKAGGAKEAAAAAAAAGDDSALHEVSLPGRDTSIELIDCPGHPRLRPKALAAAATSSVLIFFVDAADKPALKNAAEFLFELFCLPAIHERRPPMLLVANKMDHPEARGQRAVVEDLEKEIERCRVSRQLTFEGEDAAAYYLGREGSRFLLHDDSPCPLEVCCASGAPPELGLRLGTLGAPVSSEGPLIAWGAPHSGI
ncbi:hypothetical protein Emed_005885 [Eimeria media]